MFLVRTTGVVDMSIDFLKAVEIPEIKGKPELST